VTCGSIVDKFFDASVGPCCSKCEPFVYCGGCGKKYDKDDDGKLYQICSGCRTDKNGNLRVCCRQFSTAARAKFSGVNARCVDCLKKDADNKREKRNAEKEANGGKPPPRPKSNASKGEIEKGRENPKLPVHGMRLSQASDVCVSIALWL
jgi:hypothetical protein